MNQQLDREVEHSVQDSILAEAQVKDFAVLRSIKKELLEEFRSHWHAGNSVTPEEILPRRPVDPKTDRDVASLLFEDFRQRERDGESPSIRDYEQRYPEQKDSLQELFGEQAVLRSVGLGAESSDSTLVLPSVGDDLFHFHLCQELGRGSFACVFMAKQVELASRPVVLKISKIVGDEPQTLAQLQHTHIVPIYSVHEDTRSGLRAVCMPYFGGASLSQVLSVLWEDGKTATLGQELIDALKGVGSEAEQFTLLSELAIESPSHQFLRATSYLRAVVWIIARLAEGLHHAHQRGVLHRDIKPSNILLGADGQPLLLDFNLSENICTEEARGAALLGGTVAYMAPEHLRAMAYRDPVIAKTVDQRADIYSLGMVLYESLTGQGPFQQSGSYTFSALVLESMAVERSRNVPSLHARYPGAPWGLESILNKCLTPDLAQRYQRADQLAEDLQAFLDDRPLRHAPELSQRERLQKWMRRHPRLVASGTVALASGALLIGTGSVLAGVHHHLYSARQELAIKEAAENLQSFKEGTIKAICLINTTANSSDGNANDLPRFDHILEGIKVCEKTLELYDILGKVDWQNNPSWQRLSEEDRRFLSQDTRELLMLLAWGRVQAWERQPVEKKNDASRAQIFREALELLTRAEAIPGLTPSSALWMDRGYYLRELGDTADSVAAFRRAKEIKPATAHDHYLLASALVRNRSANDTEGQQSATRAAIEELNIALSINNAHYWSWLQRGICYLELNEATLAARDFGVCIGLWSDNAWGYFNSGCANDHSGKKAEAIADYTAALERDPDLLLAYRNRGIARLELQQNDAALADFDTALSRKMDEMALHAGRGIALERLGKPAEADAAFREARARAVAESTQVRQRFLCTYAFAIAQRLPAKAEETFHTVLRQDQNNIQALYGLAMLAGGRGQIHEAIKYFDQAIEISPGFIEARRFRAVLKARIGQLDAASQDINFCLEKEPRSGITLYAAACVAALAAGHTDHPINKNAATEQALAFLKKAFDAGYGREKAKDDPDLASIRKHPDFLKLLGQPTDLTKP